MQDISLGVIESKFADIIWSHAPLPSSALVVKAQEALGWKKIHHLYRAETAVRKGDF